MKRMKGLGALALACALALGAASPSLAHGRPGGPEEGLRGTDMGVMKLMNRRALDALKLTANQMEQVRISPPEMVAFLEQGGVKPVAGGVQ